MQHKLIIYQGKFGMTQGKYISSLKLKLCEPKQKLFPVDGRWGRWTLSLTFTCIAWNNKALSSPGWTPIKILHTFPFQISFIKWGWSVGLLFLSSLESWVCLLNTAWGIVHFCPLLLACLEHLHPPLTSAAVKPSPFLPLPFSVIPNSGIEEMDIFSDIYPVS